MGLFDFGKKKREAAAYEKGQQAVRAMSDQLDDLVATRHGHVKPGFLKVLNDGFDRDMDQEEHSPLLCARANYSVYLENVTQCLPGMREDVLAVMSAWRDGFAGAGFPTVVEDILNSRLEDWRLDLQTAGLKLMMDRADEFKTVDDRWRRKYPQQATLEPRD